jgi:hypothetical protein
MHQLADRMLRAAKLQPDVYEEVEADKSTLGQAIGVVVIASVAAGIGAMSTQGTPGILVGTLAALVSWVIWAGLTYLIGAKLLPEPQTEADLGQLLRTIGFASAPGVIRVVGIVPGLYQPVAVIAGIWMLAAMVVAVRQALDYQSTGRAVGVCVLGFLIQVLVFAMLFAAMGKGPGGAA